MLSRSSRLGGIAKPAPLITRGAQEQTRSTVVRLSLPSRGLTSATRRILHPHPARASPVLQLRNMSNQPKVSAENPHGVVNGQYVGSSEGTSFTVQDPATGKEIGQVPEMTVADTRKAIDAAHAAFQTYRHMPPAKRQDILNKFYSLMQASVNDITRLIVWENGKSWTDAMAEATYAASFIGWFAGEAVRMDGKTVPCSLPGTRNFTIKQPIGVCALLVPWNFPAAMGTRKIGPVLATGCTAVIKVPSETPFTTLAIVELAKRAGVPDGVLNVVTTDKHLQEIGDELVTNSLIKKVSFTGSTRIGKMLAEKGAKTLKKMSLELGGNAPLIVFEDADLPTAVAGTIASKFRGSGQTCVCANRIFVHEKVYDEYAKLLVEKVKGFKVGNGFDEGVTHGPLIHERQTNKVQEHVDDAVSKGAKVLIGGKRGKGTIFEPTVLADVSTDCLLNGEETFGPLAALIKFSTEDEVIVRVFSPHHDAAVVFRQAERVQKLANASEVGLAGYFFSQDSDRIWRVAEALEVGMVGANTGAISQAVIPFGGIKESGYGKEGAHEGTEEYMITKLVTLGSALHNIPK